MIQCWKYMGILVIVIVLAFSEEACELWLVFMTQLLYFSPLPGDLAFFSVTLSCAFLAKTFYNNPPDIKKISIIPIIIYSTLLIYFGVTVDLKNEIT